SDTTSDNGNNKHQNPGNGEDQVQVHVSTNAYTCNFYSLSKSKNYSSYKYYSLLAGHIIKFSPPPKFC
ncbi:MAG: hypothetical protein ACRDE5_12880, partial [Ginsengibacter sp.]